MEVQGKGEANSFCHLTSCPNCKNVKHWQRCAIVIFLVSL